MIKRAFVYFLLLLISNSSYSLELEQNDSLKQLIAFAKVDNLSIEENIKQGKAYLAKDVKKALRYFTNVIYSNSAVEPQYVAIAYENIGIIFIKQGEQTKAFSMLDSAMNRYVQTGNKNGIASVISNKGNAQFALGNYENALEYFLESYKMREELEDSLGLAKISNNLGIIYMSQHEDDKALEWYFKGIAILNALGNKGSQVSALNNIGHVYTRKNQYNEAIRYYQQSIMISLSNGNPDGAITAYLGLADIYTTKNNLTTALVYFKKAESLINEIGNVFKQNHMWIIGGSIYEKMENYETAILYNKKALVSSRELGMKQFESNALSSLASCYKKLGRFEEAFNYMNEYSSLNDSMHSDEKIKQIAEMHAKFETENKQKENAILESELKVKSLELRTNQLLLFGLGGILIFAIILGGLIFRNNKMKLEHRSLQLEQKLLRTQMNPHFIFNALITIESYIYENEPKLAGKYLSDFSRLMRLILDSSVQEFIPLKKELETLRFYLELQKLRMDDNFTYTIDTTLIEDLDDVNIPPMLTQPFIENAIEHGFRGKSTHGHIGIDYKLVGENDLQITVTDNGTGINHIQQVNTDTNIFHRLSAIQITKERLVVLNKSKHKKVQFHITDISDEGGIGTGTKVVFTVPLGLF